MFKRFVYALTVIFALAGLILVNKVIEPQLFEWATQRIGRAPTVNASIVLNRIGWASLSLSLLLLVYIWVVYPRHHQIRFWLKQVGQICEEWLDKYLGTLIDFNKQIPAIGSMNYVDWIIILGVAIFAFLYQIERLQGDFPNVILGSDLANITSYAMAYDHPAWFQGDFILSNTENFKIYFQLHVLLSRWFGTLLGNYDLSLLILLGPTVFIYLAGLYFLGRLILKSRYWALIFMMVNTVPVYLVFETWGVVKDPAPRTAIQALLPFLLILVWKWRERPKLWVVIAVFTGLLVYIHAVSTPIWMVAILLGIWSQMPSVWPLSKRVGFAVLLGVIMLIAGSVFIRNYLGTHVSGEIANFSEMIEVYRFILPPDILNVSGSALKIFRRLSNMWILPVAVVGTYLLFILRRGQRREVTMVLAWLAGIVGVSVILPLLERVIEAYLRLLPIETEFVRGMRYLIPILSLLGVWGLSELYNRVKLRQLKLLVMIVGLMLTYNVYQGRFMGEVNFYKTINCVKSGQLLCIQRSDLQDVLIVLRDNTEQGSPVYFSDSAYDTLPLAVRYIAQRPLVYSYKDRGAGLNDLGMLRKWQDAFSELDAQGTAVLWLENDPHGFIDFTHKLGAEYIVINKIVSKDDIKGLPVNIFYGNDTYTILELNP